MKLPLWARDCHGNYRNFPLHLFTHGKDGKWRMEYNPLDATPEQLNCIIFFGHLMIRKGVGECSAGTIWHYTVKIPRSTQNETTAMG